jgi:hypothetical protein
MEHELVSDEIDTAQLVGTTEAANAPSERGGRRHPRIRMGFVVDGARTAGIELVERLLTTGERFDGALTPEIASAAIEALEHLELPWLVDEMFESGEMLAQQIHSKASRGLQEAVQNAQDQAATTIRFGFRKRSGTSELLIAHNGHPVEVHDVVSMAYPLLSGSRADPEKIGRFGVGLKTLNQLADSLSVHCPPLPGFEITGARVRRTKDARAITGFWNPEQRETLFVLRLREESFDQQFFADWMREWNASSLVFLSSLHNVVLVNLSTKKTLVEHELSTRHDDVVGLDFGRATEASRTVLSDTKSGRSWTRYTVRYPLPKKLKATHKAIAETVSLSLAVPERTDTTRFYTGLPLDEPCDLPFSVNAPFDPNVERTQVRDHNALNEWLIARLGDLAIAVCLRRFSEKPSSGWTVVPLRSESAGRPASWLRHQADAMVERIREGVGRKQWFTHSDGTWLSLEDFVVEPEELDGLLVEDDIERLYDETAYSWMPSRRAVPRRWRGKGKRWREVLADLDGAVALDVADALTILDWDDNEVTARGISWLVRLIAGGLAADGDAVLWDKRCVVLADASRVAPADLAARGTLLVHALPEDSLASALDVGERIEAGFRADTASARRVREWLMRRGSLRERPSDADALRALARAERDTPLSLVGDDGLLLRLRDALERMPADEREMVALGLGRNIALAGFQFERGKRKQVSVTPASAYLPSGIDKNEGWPAAAAQTPGIMWIDRRYSDLLRRHLEARGQGTLALLRLLGAATAPRVVSAPPPNPHPHARLNLQEFSVQHRDELRAFPTAGGLARDSVSPDLESVVSDLMRERRVVDRRRRSQALFLCLDRAWNDRRDPYTAHATATAVRHYRTWQELGEVSATWVANLASQPWLSSRERKFTPKPPRELTVLTEASFEVEGENPGRYVYEIDAEHADSPVVEALRIQGRPWASTIIERLEELRVAEDRGESIHQAWADRCYRALGAYFGVGPYADRSDVKKRELIARFGVGKQRGLIRWNGQWLQPKEVRAGPYIGDVLPWVGERQPLWDALRIAEPDIEDCRTVLNQLASSQHADLPTEIRAYRRILALLATERRVNEKIRKFPIRTYQGWVEIGKTDVYAVPDATLAAAVGEHWPVWQTPLPFEEIRPLASMLGVIILGEDSTRPAVPAVALAGDDMQEEFPAAVGHLQDYLIRHHPLLYQKISRNSWTVLSDARVILGSDWSVRVIAPHRKALQLPVAAHLFKKPLLFCAVDEQEAATHDAGGRAVAGYLLGPDALSEELSVVSLAWEVAFHRRKDERDALDLAPPEADEPHDIPLPPLQRRQSSTRSRKKLNLRRGTPIPRPEPRELVSLDDLDLRNVRVTVLDSKHRGEIRAVRESPLKDPAPAPPNGVGRSSESTTATRGYSDREREDLALNIIREIFHDTYGLDLEDLRDQENTGADAVDRQQDVWVELKAHGRDVPDAVRLEPSEAKRAKEKRGKYWLVVAWNLEKPRTPEYVVIRDPLRRLDAYLGRGMTLMGVRELSGTPLK